MAQQRKARDEEEQALEELAKLTGDLINKCGLHWCEPGTPISGSFDRITNASSLPVGIDVSETTVTGVADFPASDFELAPGASITGNFTAVGIYNTFGLSALDPMFNVVASKKC
mgnify:CR=1 FL=1|jgi:hypothetical protein|tara:strand:- start:1428 stop:1769 length:342 start_codon:yes stop_codon:yes gene_type:complete